MGSLVTLSYLIKAKFRRKCSLVSALLVSLAIASFHFQLCNTSFHSELSQCDSTQCIHGSCNSNQCVCDFGWQGPHCDQCGGRIRLTATSGGQITDGLGNYSSDLQCTWLVDSGIENATIRLQFDYFETECSWDHLYIFDGDSVFDPLIAAYSGSFVTNFTPSRPRELTTQSGRAFLYFYSDAAYNMSGFNIFYSINSCPHNCSGHGVCVGDRCTCDADFEGDACDKQICPNNCSGKGKCDKSLHRCACNYGYVGADCSQEMSYGFWSYVSSSNAPQGRALHQAVIHQDVMYIVGGEHFHTKEDFLVRYHIKLKKWESISSTSEIEPSPRFGHSLLVFNLRLYLFGGILKGGVITKELWEYDLISKQWKLIIGHSLTQSVFCCPIASTGHTATLVNNAMYIIFGYNPKIGFLNYVQYYNLDYGQWKLIKTTGASVKGGTGHTSSYDHLTRLIYVFGGYHSLNFADNLLTDMLYAYDPKKESWSLRSPSKSPRYLHSASIINGMLLVYGGNGHNVTDDNSGEVCFGGSPLFMAYDISCDTWRALKSPYIANEENSQLGRYGHTSATYEEALYIFGGFNGIMHNRILKYTPGNCSHFPSLEECSFARVDSKCFWNKEKSICQASTQVKSAAMSNYCPENLETNFTELCQKQTLCSNCLANTYECVWCGEKCMHKKCSSPNKMLKELASTSKTIKDSTFCESRELHIFNCDKLHNCHSCHTEHYCSWQRDRKCSSLMNTASFESGPIENHLKTSEKESLDEEPLQEKSQCEEPCHTRKSCSNCTHAGCMWCSSLNQCIESNAYSAVYPIGQCMEWATHPSKCPMLTCSDIQSCSKCLRSARCGWCEIANTGIGVCLEGSSRGPVAINATHKVLDTKRCPSTKWYFTSCPRCECNGHSKCSPFTSLAMKCNCTDHTEGDNCEQCRIGYFGNSLNGGMCSKCSCGGHSEICHRETGKCSCTTKGITGNNCEKCDLENNYFGEPRKQFGGCFYNLSTSFSYTFNMSKPDDKFYTRINFMNMPSTSEIDVEFMVTCPDSSNASVDIWVGSWLNTTLNITRQLHANLPCGNIKLRFTHDEHFFGNTANTTFFVFVHSFRTPFVLQVSFSQHRNLDILQFFLTFSSCFLALLIIAAILWKVKQKYELYRRRQQLFVEMEQMASRPFAGVVLQMKNQQVNGSLSINPTPIALEPCHSGKAAILTLVVKLPSGGQQVPPSGQTGIALASALVSLGNVTLEPNCREDKDTRMCNKHPTGASQRATKLNNSTGV